MATIASNGTGGGDWSSTLTWSGGVVPGSGDDVQIVAGDTVHADSGIGAGPHFNAILLLAGTLVIDAGVTLSQTPNALTNNNANANSGELQMEAGSTLELHRSGTAPSATAGWRCRLTVNGTEGSPCAIRKVSTGSDTYIGWWLYEGSKISWCTIDNANISNAFRFYCVRPNVLASGMYCTDSMWESCDFRDANANGCFALYGGSAGVMKFKDCVFFSASSATGIGVYLNHVGWILQFENCRFGEQRDGTPDVNTGADLRFAADALAFFSNCRFSSSQFIYGADNPNGNVFSQGHQQVPGDWWIARGNNVYHLYRSTAAKRNGDYGIRFDPRRAFLSQFQAYLDLPIPVKSGDAVAPSSPPRSREAGTSPHRSAPAGSPPGRARPRPPPCPPRPPAA